MRTAEARKADEAPVPAQKAKVTIGYFDPRFKVVDEAPAVSFHEFEKGPEAVLHHNVLQKEEHRHQYELEIPREMLVGVKVGDLTAAISVRPGEELKVDLPVPAVKPETQTGTITVHVEESVRTSKGQEQTKPVGRATVLAKPIVVMRLDKPPQQPPDAEKTPISADVKNGLAVLEVKSGCLYEVNVIPSGTYAGSRQQLPVLVLVHSAKNVDLEFVFEPCKRTVTLLFVDSCGQRMKHASFYVGSQRYVADEKGGYEIEIGRPGALQLWSHEYDFSPSEIPVGESLAQATVVTVAKQGLGEVVINLLDESGNPLDKSKVYVRSKKTGEMHEGITNVKGQFRLSVPKGQYEVFAEAPSPDFDVPIQVMNV
jgi:hypothetical protein